MQGFFCIWISIMWYSMCYARDPVYLFHQSYLNECNFTSWLYSFVQKELIWDSWLSNTSDIAILEDLKAGLRDVWVRQKHAWLLFWIKTTIIRKFICASWSISTLLYSHLRPSRKKSMYCVQKIIPKNRNNPVYTNRSPGIKRDDLKKKKGEK